MKAFKAVFRLLTLQNIGAIIATFIVISEAVHFMTDIGPIWRDEAHLWTLTTQHSLLYMLHHIHLDSFPVIPHIILHSAVGLGMPDTDHAIRVFGFVTIIAIVIAIWIYSLKAHGSGPIVSMTAFALYPFMFRTFGTLRGYGMGMLFYIISFFAIWRYLETKKTRDFIIAVIMSLLSFHTLFGNAILTGMAILAAMVVCIARRDYKQLYRIVSLGAICLLSMAVYIPMLKQRSLWFDAVKVYPTYEYGIFQIFDLVGKSCYFGILIVASVMILAYIRSKRDKPIHHYWLFSAITLLCLVLVYPLYPVFAHQTLYEWHYAVMFLACAIAVDGALLMMPSIPSQTISVVLMLTLILCARNYPELSIKATDIDDVARVISQNAKPGDFIIMTEWHAQCNFARYYKGTIPYLTVLGSHDDGLEDYSKLTTWMSSEDGMNRALSQTFKTIDSGHTVWIVGPMPEIKYNGITPNLQLTINRQFDTSIQKRKNWYFLSGLEEYYVGSWIKRYSYEVHRPKYKINQMLLDASQKVNIIENYQLFKINSKGK